MMKTLPLLIVLLLSAAATAAQPALEFAEKSFDLKEISEQGETVTREFHFRNTGDQLLVILRTDISCSCTKAVFPKAPVRPGEQGTIRVSYNPRRQNGSFNKAISVYANTPERRYIITIRGKVVQ